MSVDGDQTVMFRPSVIRDLIHDAGRFHEVSVAVIDGDLPGQQNLEICHYLQVLPTRRIMVSRTIDATRVISAFNEGLIDGFIAKTDPNFFDRLEVMIRECQLDYFSRVGAELGAIIGLNESAFMMDPDFLAYFEGVFVENDFVEYFMSENPPGLLLARGDGSVQTLLVQHHASLSVYTISAAEPPPGMTEWIAVKGYQPWFPTKFGFYASEFANSWQNYLYPSRRIGPWYCSLIDGIPGRKLRRSVPSYQDHRRRLYQDKA